MQRPDWRIGVDRSFLLPHVLIEPVYDVALHPIHQNIAVSGGGDDKSYLWRVYDGEQLYEFAGHTDSVTQVGFSVDGTYVASGSMDGKVRVWKSETGEFVCELEGPDEVVVSDLAGPWVKPNLQPPSLAPLLTFWFKPISHIHLVDQLASKGQHSSRRRNRFFRLDVGGSVRFFYERLQWSLWSCHQWHVHT